MTTSGDRGARIDWQRWSPDAFARAASEAKPVLLSLHAAWAEGCAEMDRRSFSDPAVIALVTASFIPVRVDADERPDVADRYSLGGLPTTAFLNAEGGLLGGGTFVEPDRLLDILPRVRAAVVRPGATPPLPAGDDRTDAELEAFVLEAFDGTAGGFGDAPKCPHVAPVRLALEAFARDGNERMLEYAGRALDAMGWSELWDAEVGGFRHYCAGADWSSPRPEKLLSVNAALLDLYATAAELTGNDRWRARAIDTFEFLERDLRRQDGAWRASDRAEASRVFTDANARAVSALLTLSRLLNDEPVGRRALAAMEHVLLAAYRPGDGLAHYAAGPRALLADQVAMLSATLDASEATGSPVYRMMAEELAHYVIRVFADADGGFADRCPRVYADEPAASRAALKPCALNCEAAAAFGRLGRLTGDAGWLRRAEEALVAIRRAAALEPLDAAHFLNARRAVLR